MIEITTVLRLVGGLALLALGADWLVKGASSIALRFGVSALAVGLTVVAYGTSAPELVVSALAAASGKPEIAIGNVVGSNVFNVLFILGACALIAPLAITRQIVRREVPIMIAASIALLGMALDGQISNVEGVTLLVAGAAYTWWTLRDARASATPAPTSSPSSHGPLPSVGRSAAYVLVGLAALVLGARLFVAGATTVAVALGLSDTVIALTLVAAGTSLPEVATSIIATLRGQRDIAVGNVVGSNIYNILAIGGFSGLIAPAGLPVSPALLALDIPVMTAVAVACLPLFFTGSRLDRWEGGVFFGYYAAYTTYLVLSSTAQDALARFSWVMVWFVLPITLLTVLVVAVRERRRARSALPGRG
jgi:cation:H+ antiporter